MTPNGCVTLKGQVLMTLRKAETGEIIRQEQGENTIVTAGMDNIVGLFLRTGTATNIKAMALGTNSTAAATTNTALGSEVTRNSNITTSSTANGSVGFTASWQTNEANGTAIQEVGLFNNTVAAAATMFSRYVFGSAFTKDSTQTITIEYSIGMGSS